MPEPRTATSVVEVVENGLCIGCGLCEAVSGGAVKMELAPVGSMRPMPADGFTPDQEQALRDFVASGGRWLALHATNALLDFGPDGVRCSRDHDTFMETMGSRFVAHPKIEPYEVRVSDPDHPLVAGIEPFEANDELYLCEYHGEIHPLLETSFSGTFRSGYVENEWYDDEPRLVAYTHPVGDGEVLYLTLGHCCGVHDMRPIQDEAEVVRGSWENPVFIELLRRSLRWGQGLL